MLRYKNINRIILVVVTFLIAGKLFPQLKKADEYFKNFEYAKAISLYEKGLKKTDAKDTLHLIRLGVSYMRTNDYAKAEKIFGELVKIKDVNPNCYLYYGEVLHVNQKIDEAKAQFKIYAELMPKDERGKELYQTTEKRRRLDTLGWVKIWNFEKINSPYSEFSPVPYKNGMVFTSDRKSGWLDDDVCGWTNRPYLSLFYCEIKADSLDTLVKSPVPLDKRINTESHNGIGTFNAGQDRFYFTRVDNKRSRDTNFANQSKICEAEFVSNKWKNIKGFKFNNDGYSLEHPNLSPDGSKLFFASDMPGGFGGKDIYCCVKEGEGWSTPVNLGREVNSEGDEVFPHARSSSVLYFSSNGHQGYGGLDIYMTTLSKTTWTGVVNMKLPLNSNYDDFGISFFDKEGGYFSSNRLNGFGNDDIYFFSFNRKEFIVTIEKQKENVPIIGASVYVVNDQKSVADSAKTNRSGETTFGDLNHYPSLSLMLDVPDRSFKGRLDPSLVPKNMKILITRKNKVIDSVSVDSTGSFSYVHKYVNLKTNLTFAKGAAVVVRRPDGSVIASYLSGDSKDFVIPHVKNEKGYLVDILPLRDSVLEGRLVMTGKIFYEVDSAWPVSKTQLVFRIGKKTFRNVFTDSLGVFKFEQLLTNPNDPAIINTMSTDSFEIYFDYDKFDIKPADEEVLKSLLKSIEMNPDRIVEISAFADSRGSVEYNNILAGKRSKSVKEYLMKKGVKGSKIKTVSFGEEKLMNPCLEGVDCDEFVHRMNRKCLIILK